MISICIPAYEMSGRGAGFLARSLEIIQTQTYTDHETIVSDQSPDDEIEQVCARFPRVRFVKFPHKYGNASANLNHTLDHATGELVKILFLDDFLSAPDSLACMAAAIGRRAWLAHAYWHTDLTGLPRLDLHRPSLPRVPEDLVFHNSIGAPTALLLRRNRLRFDENLRWFMDCEFYYRLLRECGPPVLLEQPLAAQTLWPGQMTHMVTDEEREKENAYLAHYRQRPRRPFHRLRTAFASLAARWGRHVSPK